MIVDTSALCVFNITKKLNLDLYVVSCFKDRKFVHFYAYTTYDEAKELYDKLLQIKITSMCDFYLNKYTLKKNYLESNDTLFLKNC